VHPDLAALLESEPYRFDFFQAVRLLERMSPERRPVGKFVKPSTEVARFGAHPSSSFPASQIQSLKREEGKAPFLEVNFMGLTGPLGVLPHPYTDMVRERIRAKDTTLRDFLDLFHHRMISLFYQAWEKYRFTIAYERGDRDRFSHHLLDLIGLGTPGLQDRQEVSDDSLIFYSGLLSMNTRSATALEQILRDFFDVPVKIEQFVGAWYPMEPENQCNIGEESGASEQLGWGAVVGDEIWDHQSRIRIQLGPLPFDVYRGFLPGGDAWRELRSLTRFFTRGEFDVEVQLILKRDDVPACELGEAGEEAPQLGWSTWVKSAPFNRDPGDTVLLMD
jgi:type VI secretion system protein ImpH